MISTGILSDSMCLVLISSNVALCTSQLAFFAIVWNICFQDLLCVSHWTACCSCVFNYFTICLLYTFRRHRLPVHVVWVEHVWSRELQHHTLSSKNCLSLIDKVSEADRTSALQNCSGRERRKDWYMYVHTVRERYKDKRRGRDTVRLCLMQGLGKAHIERE